MNPHGIPGKIKYMKPVKGNRKMMNILFGIHGHTHVEIAQSEISEFRNLGYGTEVSPYGNWGTASGIIGSLGLVFKNAMTLKNNAKQYHSDYIYLNTGLDIKTLVRDSITIFILKYYLKNIKIILKIHGSQSKIVFSRFNLLKNYIFGKADLLLVLSKEEHENFLCIGIPPNKVQVTANVIDRDIYVPDAGFREKLGIAGDEFLLLFVGRFIPEKGILDLIEACRLLKEEKCRFHLYCLGTGPLFDQVQSMIVSYGLADFVTLVGHIPEQETRQYYSNCDILVLPTYHPEGFPMAVFQAVGAGKPVITTKIRAAADFLKENRNCLWVEKKNPVQLCHQILTLQGDKNLQYKMGKNNYALASEFTAEKIVKKLLEYFKNI